jgi:hypothetical protein
LTRSRAPAELGLAYASPREASIAKEANHWISHLALARIDSNTGDFTAAAKELTQAINGAPEATKPFLQPLLKRLEAKDDINK